MSHDEAARRLRWPVGTVRSRMARARDILRQRLARRGITAADGAAIATALARPPVPPHWIDATVRGSLNFATYPATAAATIASARSAAIARRLLHAMLITKLSCVGAAGLGIALAAGGAGALALQASDHARAVKPAAAASPAPGAPAPLATQSAPVASQPGQAAEKPQAPAPPQDPAAPVSPAAPPQPPHLDERQLADVGRMRAAEADSLLVLFFPQLPPLSRESVQRIVGLPTGSRPERLTWKRLYTLAILCTRAGSEPGAGLLEPAALAELAAAHGVDDFSRFRHDFLARRPGGRWSFYDPSREYVDFLRRLQVVDNARCDVALRENCLRLYQELVKGEASGLSALEVDLVEASLVRARQRLADETARFRDGLDGVKSWVGLPPRASLVPDLEGIAGFRAAFEGAYNWHRNPTRTRKHLSQQIARLPALGEVLVEGRPILAAIEANPDRLEDELAAVLRSAGKDPGSQNKGEAAPNAEGPLEPRIRYQLRRLVEARQTYGLQRRRFELASRSIDDVLTQLVAPPAGGTHGLAQAVGARLATQGLLEQLDQVQSAEDRLVGLWASFQADRLALYRDLGVLPYDDWKSFIDDLAARPGAIP